MAVLHFRHRISKHQIFAAPFLTFSDLLHEFKYGC